MLLEVFLLMVVVITFCAILVTWVTRVHPYTIFTLQYWIKHDAKEAEIDFYRLTQGTTLIEPEYLKVCIFGKNILFVHQAELVGQVLNSKNALDKSIEYSLIHPWLGQGLLTSAGDKWRRQRKILTPAFHFSILDNFLPVFHEKSIILTQILDKRTNEPFVDIVPLAAFCTLDIILSTAMGVEMNVQVGGAKDYVDTVHSLGNIFSYRLLRLLLYIDFIFHLTKLGKEWKKCLLKLHGFTWKVIKEKKKTMLAENNDNPDNKQPKKNCTFLDLLLDIHLRDPSFTEENIREEVDTFMFEGYDTTSVALFWTIHTVGLDEEVMAKIKKELDEIFEDDIERPITREDLARMKYLECVIKEVLRLYPSVPAIGRKIEEKMELKTRSGKSIQVDSNTNCYVFVPRLHRDPDVFPNPEKFIPERFLPENCVGRHPYSYIPFSGGPRNCIGQKFAMMEEKIILANIFRRFHVKSLDKRDTLMLGMNLVVRNAGPLRIKFTPRNRQKC